MHYENLPLYRRCMELVVSMGRIVKHFSRYHKYQVGADCRRQSRELIGLVKKAHFASAESKSE